MEKPVKACLLVIGDEVLEGSRQDKHAQWFAEALSEQGVWLDEVRIIPDAKERIIQAVRECSQKFNYVFTTGGLGPTHDDITTESVAAAFGLALQKDPDVDARLAARYAKKGEPYTPARQKMAVFPEGSSIIPNEEGVGVAPGFCINNQIYVFPGPPKETRPMFDKIKSDLIGGPKAISKSVSILAAEGVIASELRKIQKNHPDVIIGSYPFQSNAGRMGATVKIRATDPVKLDAAYALLAEFIDKGDLKTVEAQSSGGRRES